MSQEHTEPIPPVPPVPPVAEPTPPVPSVPPVPEPNPELVPWEIGKGSGIAVTQDEAHVWTVRDGRSEVGGVLHDRTEALEAARPSDG